MKTLERLLQHDAGTTGKLLELARGLPEEALDQEFEMGHRTLLRTFVHIVGNMECWCDLMEGKPQRAVRGETVAELIGRTRVVGEELVALGRRVEEAGEEEGLFVDYLDDPPRKKPLGAGLVHVATHGMHHRAQCLYMMRRLGVEGLIEGDVMSWELEWRGNAKALRH